ncbi:MAG: TIGR02281 family clan AA aspartic protease [Gammaproteobacteria bacterium]|jgi:aspartyl protease family protein|nr:TIGR02281 family clan AA aspartic protease [Gammaproteobacteria bacterium]MBT3859978.1 TIGR02281 family clan AA aspartic protease [Gammaproteobacteria bacterium]MBT3986440.1 TIGR02281 family clan AA aspartic protease [Gammaproteobacteria bacterium]MBT4255273.1 TIGR02281 family clan AA aspartic protease [Gammaproteobacteria bacterium]MBT4580829.1 TIGR02281 family clan AA aspartic protease [Gammaproteobacteria bacterium]
MPKQLNNKHNAAGRNLGQGMLIASFVIALLGMTFFFDSQLMNQINPNSNPESSESSAGVREVILQRNRQGHYVTSGSINDVEVIFLLDTGATDVAISPELAAKAGLQPGNATQASTANGIITVYSTNIDSLSISSISLENVNGSINPGMSGETILLGMSVLKEIEFSQRGSILTLRQYPET